MEKTGGQVIPIMLFMRELGGHSPNKCPSFQRLLKDPHMEMQKISIMVTTLIGNQFPKIPFQPMRDSSRISLLSEHHLLVTCEHVTVSPVPGSPAHFTT